MGKPAPPEMKDVEAVVLSGGLSRRMGTDKATLLVQGEPILQRITRLLSDHGISSTVLGPQGQIDLDPGAGPLAALAEFKPAQPYVFVASCDLPLFDGRLPSLFLELINECNAAIPEIEGRLQPLCALYRASAFFLLRELSCQGERRVFAWIDRLEVQRIRELDLTTHGIHARSSLGANTPEAWESLLAEIETP